MITYKNIDGEWFLRIDAADTDNLAEGKEVTVTKKDGSTKIEILGAAINIQKNYTIACIATPRTNVRRATHDGRGDKAGRDYDRGRGGRVYRGEASRVYRDDGTVVHRGPDGRAWVEY